MAGLRVRQLGGFTALQFTAVLCAASASAALAPAQIPSTLPPTSPTSTTAPLAATATSADRPRSPRHHAEVTCPSGQLEVRADNSSLNSILRSIARCTGMKITGGVVDERVFGNYGPAPAATVIATLLDGTGSNMLLRETASDAPAELILTPRTGGATPPSPTSMPDADAEDATAALPQPAAQPNQPTRSGYATPQANQTPSSGSTQGQGTVFTSPPSMPPTTNNVMGSPNNTSPTASTYPTTNSVPLDSLPTPSTTPSPSGIVDAPNPPAAGSDTARMLNRSTTNVPGTTNIVNAPTSNATAPGGTNTSTPVPGNTGTNQSGTNQPGTATPAAGALTPEQVYQQLRQMQHGKQQQQAPTTPTPAPANPTPAPQ